MKLTDMLALSHVPRWSIVPLDRTQSVADHSFRVVVIYLELCARVPWDTNWETLMWAIHHDGAESRTADIPGNFKVHLGNLNDHERHVCGWLNLPPFIDFARRDSLGKSVVKLADLIETYTFISMNGFGSHALRATDKISRQVLDHAVDLGKVTGKDFFGVTERMIADIQSEREREP